MISLTEYMMTPKWDGHIHLIGNNPKYRVSTYAVCIPMLLPEKDNKIESQFENFFCTNKDIILLNGNGREELSKLLASNIEHNGVGEIDFYKVYKDDNDEVKTYMSNTIDIALKQKKPIYVHCDLDSTHDQDFEDMVKNTKNKIMLCHCGVSPHIDNLEHAVKKSLDLMNIYNNLWCDISWSTLSYFCRRHDLLNKYDKSRIVLGTDIYTDSESDIQKRKDELTYLSNYIDNERNIHEFFYGD